MYCLVCGQWAAGDPETGYDADGICITCTEQGWYEDQDGLTTNDTWWSHTADDDDEE